MNCCHPATKHLDIQKDWMGPCSHKLQGQVEIACDRGHHQLIQQPHTALRQRFQQQRLKLHDQANKLEVLLFEVNFLKD